jgi:hypothetical protein
MERNNFSQGNLASNPSIPGPNEIFEGRMWIWEPKKKVKINLILEKIITDITMIAGVFTIR